MRRLLLGAFSFVLIGNLLCSGPIAAFAEPERGVHRLADTSLDPCQKRFAEALRWIDRERSYAEEKASYRETLEGRVAGKKWYNFGFLECLLSVPIFGLIVPFFGLMLLSRMRTMWRRSSSKANE
jgi:fatty-acid desaturase